MLKPPTAPIEMQRLRVSRAMSDSWSGEESPSSQPDHGDEAPGAQSLDLGTDGITVNTGATGIRPVKLDRPTEPAPANSTVRLAVVVPATGVRGQPMHRENREQACGVEDDGRRAVSQPLHAAQIDDPGFSSG